MTSAARIAANRRNALLSTGPRSPEGRDRTRSNALKHGLATSIWADPVLSAQTRMLAGTFAAGSVDGEVIDAAERAAEAAVEALRVRTARTQLMSRAFAASPSARSPMDYVPDRLLARWLLRGRNAKRSRLADKIGWIQIDATEQEKDRALQDERVSALMRIEPQLARLERYERRALSKRNSALRKLAKLQAAGRKGRP